LERHLELDTCVADDAPSETTGALLNIQRAAEIDQGFFSR
jgi:hypothetical protein